MRGYFSLTVQQQLMTGAAAIVMVASASPVMAQTRTFDVPAGPASRTIPMLAKQAGVQVLASGDVVRSKRTRSVRGSYSVDAALRLLLEGTGLEASGVGATGIITIRASSASSPRQNSQTTTQSGEADAGNAPADDESVEILVTGSRIRGAPSAAPVIVVTAKDARTAGQSDLGQVIRSIPQNFTGGQNPGIVGSAAQGAGSLNLNNASNVNLRGLGPSASLTLLNGRRLAYGGVNQGVDISSIPLAAVDRLEIVADGGSALYGSDAIGGVANVILKRDFQGLQTEVLVGGSTDGAYSRRQLSATAGQNWGSGGVIVSGVFERTGEITVGERSYASPLNASTVLMPGAKNWGGLASAHQNLTNGLSFGIDALYNHRDSKRAEASTIANPASVSGSRTQVANSSFLFSPHLDFSLPGRWRGSLNSTYGGDKTFSDATFASAGTTSRSAITYTNRTKVAELNGEGPLTTLPGGDIRLAIGAGYRGVDLTRQTQAFPAGPVTAEWSRRSTYGFGELFVPIVSPNQSISGIDRLTFTAAIRYENHSGLGGVTTPKFGVVYAPTRDFQLSATWGRSFKTPTLFEQYQGYRAVLITPALFGGTLPTPSSTALYLEGGNPDLRPERSTNWTVTGSFRPASIEGLKLDVSYFNIAYRDRIIAPISSIGSALSNPVYAQFIVRSPSAAEQAADIAGSNAGLQNFTGGTYVPANVIAIVDARLKNVARQRAEGVDISFAYRADIAEGQSLQAALGGTYLKLDNQLRPTDSIIPLAGTIFNPPHWRGRGSLTWEAERGTIGVFANYLGPLADIRPGSTKPSLGSQWTFDLTGAVRFRIPAVAQRVELRFAALNLLDAKPNSIWAPTATAVPFESVNYSVIGRQVTVSLGITW